MNIKLAISALVISAAISMSSFAPSAPLTPGHPKEKTVAPHAATVWTVDKAHSNVKFTVTHMVVSEVGGTFKVFDGTMEHTKPDYSDAKINFSVDVTSVNTDNERETVT